MTAIGSFNAASLKPYFESLGYCGPLLRENFRFGEERIATLVGFGATPIDARTACIAAIDGPQETVSSIRQLGAPVVLVCHLNRLEFWKETSSGPDRVEGPIPLDGITEFFRRYQSQFSPQSIHRAKTWGRFDPSSQQLTFVDVGLMTAVEREIGDSLGRLIEHNVASLRSDLKWSSPTDSQGQWLLRSVFWLVAAKILADKAVSGFASLDLTDIDEVYARLANHYGAGQTVSIASKRQREALVERANSIRKFSSLANASTESLAYVYENALISKATRQALGTHSTPAYLVDYIVGKLADWIEAIPVDDRTVFEPGCGHAAFLVAAMRLLRELLPPERAMREERHEYLRARLHGCDRDAFALEIARLSLTLADVPNPNGWDLPPVDMFDQGVLSEASKSATILLANPPFEDFRPSERKQYHSRGSYVELNNKASELLMRTLPHLPPGAVFGVVVPQGVLHSKNAVPLRRFLAGECELREICLFPDKVFNKSDAESAVLLGRRSGSDTKKRGTVSYRRVRERDIDDFRRTYAVTSKREIAFSRFNETADWDMRIPDLEEIWQWVRNYPRLDSIVEIGQGLAFHGRALPAGAVTFQKTRFAGSHPGFVRFDVDFTHQLPTKFWLNLSPEVILHKRTGVVTGRPQVLLNYAPVSRGPWRLKALLDRAGHAVTSRFLTIRPRSEDLTLEFLWALFNSPVANAYAYAHLMKRDILAGTMRQMPIPGASPTQVERVTQAARTYLLAIDPQHEGLTNQQDPKTLRRFLLQTDAEVLRLYDLPPRLERQLLDLFAGSAREGVPFSFKRFFPEEFEPAFPLCEYLSADLQQSTVGRLREGHRAIESEEWATAMDATIDAFRE